MLARVAWRAPRPRPRPRAHLVRAAATRASDELFVDTADAALAALPLVTAADLAREPKLPAGVRMLARDFIDNALYNPHYGYFSKRAVIFSPTQDAAKGFDFANMHTALYPAFDLFDPLNIFIIKLSMTTLSALRL